MRLARRLVGPRRHLHTLRRVAVQSEIARLVAGLRGLEGSADDRPAPGVGHVHRGHEDPESEGKSHRRLSKAKRENPMSAKSLIAHPSIGARVYRPPRRVSIREKFAAFPEGGKRVILGA